MKTIFCILLLSAALSSAFADSFIKESQRLFHAGNRSYLEDDIRQQTIPQDVWDKVIFGTSDFDLPEYRKGLYGAETLSGTSLYATYKILAGVEPWVMVINVKPECLTHENLFEAYYQVAPAGTGNNLLFTQWYRKNEESLKPLEATCTTMNDSWKYWTEGVLYSLNAASPEDQLLSKTCAPVLNQFLNDSKIKVVGDNANPDSWYIRDRSCIESIKGSPNDLFTLLLENKLGPEYLEQNIFGNTAEPGTYTAGSLYIIMRVLAETTLLDKAHLEGIDSIVKNLSYSKQEILEKRKDISFASTEDSGYLFSALLRATQKAIRTNNVAAFQKNLLTLLNPLVKDHGRVCHGKLGVSKEYLASCNEMGAQYGKKLINLFLR